MLSGSGSTLRALITDPDLFLARGPQELGGLQVPRAAMALVVPPGHQAVLALKEPKDFRARR